MLQLNFFSLTEQGRRLRKCSTSAFGLLIQQNYMRSHTSSIMQILKKRVKTAQKHIDDIVTNKIFETIKHMKFDTIIQNPPYNGSLHLDFLEKGLDLLDKNGKMVIIEPATWLINVRKNGKTKIYDRIKQRIEGHVEKWSLRTLIRSLKPLYMFHFPSQLLI